jgi:hypothetical protein
MYVLKIHGFNVYKSSPTNSHWARVVDYGPFPLCVIHKEGLCSSSGDINMHQPQMIHHHNQMMMMMNHFGKMWASRTMFVKPLLNLRGSDKHIVFNF